MLYLHNYMICIDDTVSIQFINDVLQKFVFILYYIQLWF